MYKKFVVSFLLFLGLFNLSQGHFWSSIWNETLPRPLVQEDFHQIISRFKDNFDRYERNFDKIWNQMKGDVKSKYYISKLHIREEFLFGLCSLSRHTYSEFRGLHF